MSVRTHRGWLPQLFAVVLAIAGCPSSKRLVSTPAVMTIGAPFRLEPVKEELVLFPPSIPRAVPIDSEISVESEKLPDWHANGDCAADQGPFRIEITKRKLNSIRITLPSVDRWIDDLKGLPDASGNAIDALDAVLAKLDTLQQEGCFEDGGFAIRNFFLQSIPMRPYESSLSVQGYRPDKDSLDLSAGMRVKVERAYFKDPQAGKSADANKDFVGLGTAYFDVESADDDKIRFHHVGDLQFAPPSVKAQAGRPAQDFGLANLAPQVRYRLLLYTLVVATERTLAAAVIGAPSLTQLDTAERQLRLKPDEGCSAFGQSASLVCVEFHGSVSVSGMISVTLNGNPQFVVSGTRLKDLISKDSLGFLEIQRKFLGAYHDVRFDRNDANVLSLALTAGDNLTWKKTQTDPHPLSK